MKNDIVINSSDLLINSPKIMFSLFIPLGENSIIQLVDNFRSRNDITIIETDLYYIVKIEYEKFIITFYSRGLITIEKTSSTERLSTLIEKTEELKPNVFNLLTNLLTEYQISLISVLGDLKSIPFHKNIVLDNFGGLSKSTDNIVEITNLNLHSEEDWDKFLNSLAKDPLVSKFIGDARSVDHRSYEDVIIGIKGSIIRSETEEILSYHAFNRSLHLFFTKYNLEIENVWTTLNKSENLVENFENYINEKFTKKELKDQTLFSNDRRKSLGKTRLYVIQSIKNINQFIVLTNFIEESIDFTYEKYLNIIEKGLIKENSFHIRKTIQILQDRAKHLKIISESFSTRGITLISQLELYDSEIAFETQQRIEKIAFTIGFLGLIIALIAIFADVIVNFF